MSILIFIRKKKKKGSNSEDGSESDEKENVLAKVRSTRAGRYQLRETGNLYVKGNLC